MPPRFGNFKNLIYVCAMISLNRLVANFITPTVSLGDKDRVSHHFAALQVSTETRLRATGVDFSPVFTRKFATHSTLITAQSKLNRSKHGVLVSIHSIIRLSSRVGGRLTIAKTITRHFLFNIIDIIGKHNAFKRAYGAILRSQIFGGGSPRLNLFA